MTGQPSSDITQALFRTLLDATSRPGKSRCVNMEQLRRPNTLLILTADCLLDHEITFTVIGDQPLELTQYLQSRTGARHCDLNHADFVFVDGKNSHGGARQVQRGTLAYPDLGATMVYQLPPVAPDQLESRRLETVVLSGPGIRNKISPPADCLDILEFMLLQEINADYPLGVDAIILWGDTHMMAIPRSTRIEVK
jgi:phosphonate C-P lyase system protein PhnH